MGQKEGEIDGQMRKNWGKLRDDSDEDRDGD